MNPSKALTLLSLVAVHVLAAVAVFIHADRPWLQDGQRYEVYASGLSNVANIVIAPDRSFYVSQQLPDGKGQVVRIKHGERNIVLHDLHRPDSLALTPTSLFVTEEIERGRVVRLDLTSLEQGAHRHGEQARRHEAASRRLAYRVGELSRRGQVGDRQHERPG